MACGQRCSLCSRFILFLILAAGITLSVMSIWSCSFLDSTTPGGETIGAGLFRYNNQDEQCVVYSEDFQFTNSDQTARVCGLIAPIIAAGAGLLGLIQLLCCNICCARCFISTFFTCAQIAQALTFFFFNGFFCEGEITCALSYGGYYSIGAWGAYFLAGVILCLSPKPDPICCNKKDKEAERIQDEFTAPSPMIEPDDDGFR